MAWAAALVFVRVGAMVALMPGLGEQAVPQRVKLALVVAFTAGHRRRFLPIDVQPPDWTQSFLALGGRSRRRA